MTSGGILLDHVSVAFGRLVAVHDVSGRFEPGSMTAVCGPNGAGKSTLVRATAGLLRPSAGRVLRSGLAPLDIAYLPQAAAIDRSFPISVADFVLLGAWRSTGAFGSASRETRRDAGDALAAVGLDGFGARQIGSLSSGQFQRVQFARMMLQAARVMLLDEPFAAVDSRTTHDLLGILHRWHGEGRTVIAVLHDFDLVRAHFPETLLLARDQIAWGPTAASLSDGHLKAARALAEHWNDEPARGLAA